MNIDISF